MILHGLRVIVNPDLTERRWEQFRFPRSKRRRIRKKWSKRRDNWRLIYVGPGNAYQCGDALYVSPEMLELLKRKIDESDHDPRLDKFAGIVGGLHGTCDWGNCNNPADTIFKGLPICDDCLQRETRGKQWA